MGFTEWLTNVNGAINSFVWGPVILVLLVGTGVWYTIRTGVFQFSKFGHMMKTTLGSVFKGKKDTPKGAVTPFQAMTTALAATRPP